MDLLTNKHTFQAVTLSSSEEGDRVQHIVSDDNLEQTLSDDNSREAARKAEEFSLDSSDFLHIDEDLNLEELMKQKLS